MSIMVARTLLVEGAEADTEDWVVVQAYEKPFINLVWLGLFVLTGGFILIHEPPHPRS